MAMVVQRGLASPGSVEDEGMRLVGKKKFLPHFI